MSDVSAAPKTGFVGGVATTWHASCGLQFVRELGGSHLYDSIFGRTRYIQVASSRGYRFIAVQLIIQRYP
jgi:hypothetical protein